MHLTALKWAMVSALAVIVTGGVLAALVPRALAAAADAAKVAAELKKLQGTWLVVAIEQDGVKKEGKGDKEQIKIEGEAFGVSRGGHVEERGKIKLDPSQDPMRIDFELQDAKNAGRTDLAIYTWDGANLKICGVRGLDKHPTDFVTKPGDRCVLLFLKRQDP